MLGFAGPCNNIASIIEQPCIVKLAACVFETLVSIL